MESPNFHTRPRRGFARSTDIEHLPRVDDTPGQCGRRDGERSGQIDLGFHAALAALEVARGGGDARLTVGKEADLGLTDAAARQDRKSTRLNSSHVKISYAVFCLKKKKQS